MEDNRYYNLASRACEGRYSMIVLLWICFVLLFASMLHGETDDPSIQWYDSIPLIITLHLPILVIYLFINLDLRIV